MIDEKKLFENNIDTGVKEFVEYLWNSGYRFGGDVNRLISSTGEVCTYYASGLGYLTRIDDKNIYCVPHACYGENRFPNYGDIEVGELTNHGDVYYARIFGEVAASEVAAGEVATIKYELVVIDRELKTIRDFSKDGVVIITTPKCSKMYTSDELALLSDRRYRTAIIPETLENENSEMSIVQLHEAAEKKFLGNDAKAK